MKWKFITKFEQKSSYQIYSRSFKIKKLRKRSENGKLKLKKRLHTSVNLKSLGSFINLITEKSGEVELPGDDGISVFSEALCRRVRCQETKEIVENIECRNGRFSPKLPPCGEDEKFEEAEEIALGRLGTASGSSGSSHITGATQE